MKRAEIAFWTEKRQRQKSPPSKSISRAADAGRNPFDALPGITGFHIVTLNGVNTAFFSSGNSLYMINLSNAAARMRHVRKSTHR
jgi:hypothetical protein